MEEGNAQPNDGQSSVQARIDELTREKYEAQRRAEELQAKLLEQALKVQEAQAAAMQFQQAPPQQPPRQADPFESWKDKVDPNALDFIKDVLTKRETEFQRQLQQVQAQTAQQLAQMQFAQLVNGVDPAIAQRAQQLMQSWAARGLQLQPHDALTFAKGEEFDKRRQAQAAFANPNTPPPAMTPSAPPRSSTPKGPEDFDDPEF